MGEENNIKQNNPVVDTSAMKMPGNTINQSHLGPILGILLILLVIVAVGLYLWGASLVEQKPVTTPIVENIPNNEPETPRAEADMQIFGTLSPSNELSTIDADVSSTNLDSLGSDLKVLEQEVARTAVE